MTKLNESEWDNVLLLLDIVQRELARDDLLLANIINKATSTMIDVRRRILKDEAVKR